MCVCVCVCLGGCVGQSATPLWLPIKAGLAFAVGVQCLSDHVFVKHLLPCENPSQLSVHCSVSGQKQLPASCHIVQVCLCSGSVHEKISEERWKESTNFKVAVMIYLCWKKSRESVQMPFCWDFFLLRDFKSGWDVHVRSGRVERRTWNRQ